MYRDELPKDRPPTVAPRRVKYVRNVDDITGISDDDRAMLKKVAEKYVFRANDYYLKLIDWSDPADPIRQLIIPRKEELNDWGDLDASNEASNTVATGVQHKYSDTALMLTTEVCGSYCRYCFRKRLFMQGNNEAHVDLTAGVEYVRQHPEITNVLLTGGDPLLLSTRRLGDLISALREIPHVRIIRIGSKMPAFNPFRVLDDPELQQILRENSTPRKRIYMMCHFDHPRELTDEAIQGLDCLINLGVICVNQCPIVKGINDDSDVLAELFSRLSYVGCPQYYLFQGRPTAGNEPYEVPIVRDYQLYADALQQASSGLARRPRFVMSHELGKIEILAVDDDNIYLRFQRSKYANLEGHFFICQRKDDAYWLDQLQTCNGENAIAYLRRLFEA